jgi:hypothetical protein
MYRMRNRRRLLAAAASLLVGGLLGALSLPAQEANTTVERVPDAAAHRPTAIPDRIILTWEGDPARGQSVSWRTDTQVTAAVAQIAPARSDPGFVTRAQTVRAVTTPLATDLGTAHYHSARFTDLTPDTLYAYRVGDGANWSEWNQFQTASATAKPFSFLYFGDAQNDIKSLWSRVVRSAFRDAPRARFLVHAGDLINAANRDAEWGEWHAAGGWVNATVPSVPSPGNHEYDKKQLSGHWRPQFALPLNGPPGLEETCYYLDYQGVRIVSLNTEERQAEQAEWLDRVLTDNPHRWTILTFHRPMYSSAKGRDNAGLRQKWVPVFDKHHVDLVLQGHDHTYARSRNLRAGVNVRDDRSGTVYVVSVSGTKMYHVERQPWMRRTAEDTQLYQIISVDGDRLRYQARTATGALYDAFDLVKPKRGAGPNRLIERTPRDVPENRRPEPPPPGTPAAG